ncbi:MAG: glycosyltransferase [Bacteroidaceae bacterium]|nr:glycosyltransferase [Bacteroidaceae bacterium]
MENPQITVITICYNAVDEIEKTILSVINQTYKKREYIVVDGGSKDGTIDLIKKYGNWIDCWVSEPDRGIYDAMNKGLKLAKGEWVNFMNAGDSFADEHVFENLQKFFIPENDVVYGDVVVEKLGIKYLQKAQPKELQKENSPRMGFVHQACFVKTSFAKMYPFDLKYKLAADFNMVMTIYRNGGKFVYAAIPVANYDLSGVSTSNRRLHRYECLMIKRPESKWKNTVEAYLHFFNSQIRTFAKKVLITMSPQLMVARNDHRQNHSRYEEHDTRK